MPRVFALLQTGGMVLANLHANIFCFSLGSGKEILFGVYGRSGPNVVNTIFHVVVKFKISYFGIGTFMVRLSCLCGITPGMPHSYSAASTCLTV